MTAQHEILVVLLLLLLLLLLFLLRFLLVLLVFLLALLVLLVLVLVPVLLVLLILVLVLVLVLLVRIPVVVLPCVALTCKTKWQCGCRARPPGGRGSRRSRTFAVAIILFRQPVIIRDLTAVADRVQRLGGAFVVHGECWAQPLCAR